MAHSIVDHLKYNVWANEKMAGMLNTVEPAIIFKENKSSFQSIAKTMLHMSGAELIWLKRMQGESLAEFPSVSFGDLPGLLNHFKSSSAGLLNFINSQPQEFLSSRYEYLNLKGEAFSDIVEDTLYHVVNHGTYHRGQIICMLRDCGVTSLVSTDLILYLRSAK
jgi:uncharacterized damage-inducible protein DinB